DEFDEADLCFSSNNEMNIFDEILDSYGQLRSEESNSLVEAEAEADLTDSEEGELDKSDEIPRHRVYYCFKGRRYEAKKKAHTLEERNKTHENSDCDYHINFQRWKSDNQVHISGIIGKHSHQMSNNIQMTAPQYRRLTSEMREDIELLSASGVRTGAIINVLTKKYPDQYIHARSVYNIVQTIKSEKEKLSDAGATYKELISRLVATALIMDEQKITFEWILQGLLNATG
ncbi:15737_t:CDS:2, partial [Racocetra fulgida]